MWPPPRRAGTSATAHSTASSIHNQGSANSSAMSSHATILGTLHALASDGHPGAIVVAENAIDAYARGVDEQSQVIALDEILRDLAHLRTKASMLDPFLSDLERYIDILQRDLSLKRQHA